MNQSDSLVTISVFQRAKSPEPLGTFPILEEIAAIKNGLYREAVTRARELLNSGDVDGYKRTKETLPAVTFSGVFSPRRKKENLTVYTGFIVIDIDKLDELSAREQRSKLFSNPHVVACWLSPSARGIKILFKCSSDIHNHKFYFDSLVQYVKTEFGLEVDTTGSDITRLCFSSYDQELLCRNDYNIYTIDVEEFAQRGLFSTRSISTPVQRRPYRATTVRATERRLLYATEGKNKPQARKLMKNVIKYLQKNNASITSGYVPWFEVGYAIASAFSYDIGLPYYLALCKLDGAGYHEEKCIGMLNYCYRNIRPDGITFGTIVHFAKQKGFRVKKIRPGR